MEETKELLQFDSSLGGKENLPNEVHLLKFAAARSKEIAAMTECIMNPCSSKLVFQTLPVHMRRRIMSHNSKRLPRRLRAAYEAQLAKSGQPLKLKRPSRKYRRRPKNLLNEYNRRMRNHVWLETHIWHAKRFHMTEKWGYKLPFAPCDRAYRSCYRATSKHCLLQDISYYPSLQIAGNLDTLSAGFNRITSNQCGLHITAQAYLSGKRAGNAYIFHLDKYPMKCIGKITFLWRGENKTDKILWMFAHPSYYKELLETLVQCFKLSLSNDEYDIPMKKLKLDNENDKSQDVIVAKMLNNKTYKSKEGITLKEIKDSVNYFRLTGPLSHAILSKAITPLNATHFGNNDSNWFVDICKDSTEKSIHETQSKFWCKVKSLKSPSELPCHLIVGLNVKDPRTNFPQKRTKALPNDKSEINVEDLIRMPDNLSHSHLWNADVRNKISSKIITTGELNKLRENHSLVPGEYCPILDTVPGVPVLLIQRPGSQNSQHKRIGYNSGWDIVVPSGYGMAFWLSMVLRGARVGGLREASKTAYESGNSDFMQPDTVASQVEEMENSKLLLNKYFRLPPNKRVNYTKLSINSPFLCRWQTLCNDWRTDEKTEDFMVIRDKSVLKSLKEMISTKKIIPSFNWNMNALVPVKLSSKNKGKLSNFGLICLPNNEDTISKKSMDLLEPLKKDINQKVRQNLRREHKLELTKLRRRRVRLKRKLLEKAEKFVEIPKQNNSELNESYMSKMRELWLPSHVDNVRHQCSRETMGYITHGDFSFTEAKGYGVGYVALQSIKSLVQTTNGKQCLVLTRNTTSKQYRFSTIDVITEY